MKLKSRRTGYDHAFSGVRNPSNTANVATPPGPQDFLNGTGLCGDTSKTTPLAGQNGRCGLGPRQPLLVISPCAKHNSVDHTVTDLSSVTKFVEDNWNLPRIAGSFDAIAGPLNNMFDFHGNHGHNDTLYLDPVTRPVPQELTEPDEAHNNGVGRDQKVPADAGR